MLLQVVEKFLSMTETVCTGDRSGLHDTSSSCHNMQNWIQAPQSLWHRFFSSGPDLISDKEAELP